MGFKDILGTVAPFLTAGLPGPFGGIANALIGKALGLPPGAKPDDVQTALNRGDLTGEQLVAIKAAELDYQKTMADLGFKDAEKLADLANQDRDSARKREIAVRDWTPRLLAFAVTAGFFGILAYLLMNQPPPGSRDIINIMLGSLGTSFVAIIAYYFGSSAGSARKTELLSQAPAVNA